MRRTITTVVETCDRCSGPLKPPTAGGYEIVALIAKWEAHDPRGEGAGGKDAIDLCYRCTYEFRQWLKKTDAPHD